MHAQTPMSVAGPGTAADPWWRQHPILLAAGVAWATLSMTLLSAEIASRQTNWYEQALSTTGTSQSADPWVFRIGIAITAGCTIALGLVAWQVLAPAVSTGAVSRLQRLAIALVAFGLAAFQLVALLVPYNLGREFQSTHNLAGWGQAWLVGISMVMVAVSPEFLGGSYRRASAAAFGGLLACFVLRVTNVATYAGAELGAIAVVAAWSLPLFARLDAAARAAAEARRGSSPQASA